MAGIVGARVRIQSLSGGKIISAFIQSYQDHCYFLNLDQIEHEFESNLYIVQGIKSGNLYTTTGQIERILHHTALLKTKQAPNIRYLDFSGSFLRENLNVGIGSPLKKVPSIMVAMGERSFMVETSADFTNVTYAALSIFDEGREFPYNVRIECTFPHGKLFRVIGQIEHPARVLGMYWNKLAKSA